MSFSLKNTEKEVDSRLLFSLFHSLEFGSWTRPAWPGGIPHSDSCQNSRPLSIHKITEKSAAVNAKASFYLPPFQHRCFENWNFLNSKRALFLLSTYHFLGISRPVWQEEISMKFNVKWSASQKKQIRYYGLIPISFILNLIFPQAKWLLRQK